MAQHLPIRGGAVSLVDDDVYAWASLRPWHLGGGGKKGGRYARTYRQEGSGTRGRRIVSEYLHRLILNPPADKHVDHINGDRLDNRRENLRLVTPSENAQNQTHANGRSGIRGVVWNGTSSTWIGSIQVDGRRVHVGTYATKEDAATAVAAARQSLLTHAPVCAEAPIAAPPKLPMGPRRAAVHLVRAQRMAGGMDADGPAIERRRVLAVARLEAIAREFA